MSQGATMINLCHMRMFRRRCCCCCARLNVQGVCMRPVYAPLKAELVSDTRCLLAVMSRQANVPATCICVPVAAWSQLDVCILCRSVCQVQSCSRGDHYGPVLVSEDRLGKPTFCHVPAGQAREWPADTQCPAEVPAHSNPLFR